MTVISASTGTATGLSHSVLRHLRHEMGDLLQTIYASVAIIQERLPKESAFERRILTDLRARAENCKQLLDDVHDLLSPLAHCLRTCRFGSAGFFAGRFPEAALHSAGSAGGIGRHTAG